MSVDIVAVASLGTCSAAGAAAKQIYSAKTKHMNIVIYRTQITGSVYISQSIL